jgi:uncharacterized protein YndB with AHSA1/START domain
MKELRTKIQIQAPVEEVWNVLMNQRLKERCETQQDD